MPSLSLSLNRDQINELIPTVAAWLQRFSGDPNINPLAISGLNKLVDFANSKTQEALWLRSDTIAAIKSTLLSQQRETEQQQASGSTLSQQRTTVEQTTLQDILKLQRDPILNSVNPYGILLKFDKDLDVRNQASTPSSPTSAAANEDSSIPLYDTRSPTPDGWKAVLLQYIFADAYEPTIRPSVDTTDESTQAPAAT